MPDTQEYLTTEEACAYLGVTRKTLDRYADQGRVNRYKRGILRTVYYKRSELDALLVIRPEQEREN